VDGKVKGTCVYINGRGRRGAWVDGQIQICEDFFGAGISAGPTVLGRRRGLEFGAQARGSCLGGGLNRKRWRWAAREDASRIARGGGALRRTAPRTVSAGGRTRLLSSAG
jgi:hypothetical protein